MTIAASKQWRFCYHLWAPSSHLLKFAELESGDIGEIWISMMITTLISIVMSPYCPHTSFTIHYAKYKFPMWWMDNSLRIRPLNSPMFYPIADEVFGWVCAVKTNIYYDCWVNFTILQWLQSRNTDWGRASLVTATVVQLNVMHPWPDFALLTTSDWRVVLNVKGSQQTLTLQSRDIVSSQTYR